MADHFKELLKTWHKQPILGCVEANIIRTFCPHMFFQDTKTEMECRTPTGKLKKGFSCEKCWGHKIGGNEVGKKSKEVKEVKEGRGSTGTKPSKKNGVKKSGTRDTKNKRR